MLRPCPWFASSAGLSRHRPPRQLLEVVLVGRPQLLRYPHDVLEKIGHGPAHGLPLLHLARLRGQGRDHLHSLGAVRPRWQHGRSPRDGVFLHVSVQADDLDIKGPSSASLASKRNGTGMGKGKGSVADSRRTAWGEASSHLNGNIKLPLLLLHIRLENPLTADLHILIRDAKLRRVRPRVPLGVARKGGDDPKHLGRGRVDDHRRAAGEDDVLEFLVGRRRRDVPVDDRHDDGDGAGMRRGRKGKKKQVMVTSLAGNDQYQGSEEQLGNVLSLLLLIHRQAQTWPLRHSCPIRQGRQSYRRQSVVPPQVPRR